MDEELAKLERYQTALAHLSEELDKLKQADGNLPEVTSFMSFGCIYVLYIHFIEGKIYDYCTSLC